MWWMFSASGFWWYMKDCYAHHDHHTAPHVHVPTAHSTHVAMAPALTETVNQCTTGSPPAQPVVVTHAPHTNIIINTNNNNKNNYHNSTNTNTVVVNSTNNKKKSRVCCNNVAEDLRTIWGCLPPKAVEKLEEHRSKCGEKVDRVNCTKGTIVVNHNNNNSSNDKQQLLKTAEDTVKGTVKQEDTEKRKVTAKCSVDPEEVEEKRTMNGGGGVVSSDLKCQGKKEEDEEEEDGGDRTAPVDMTCASSETPKAEVVVNAEDKRQDAAARRLEVERRLREMRQRQAILDRRSERKLRRVFKLEALQAGHHVADQLARLVKHHWDNRMSSSGMASTVTNRDVERITGGVGGVGAAGVSGGSSGILQNDGVKSMSTAALVNLVRKLESGLNDRTSSLGSSSMAFKQRLGFSGQPMNVQRQLLQQFPGNTWPSMSNPLALQRLQQVKANSGNVVMQPEASAATCSGFVVDGKVSKDVSAELERTSSSLQAVVTTIQQCVDSDATESSSGGESCDEREDFADSRVDEVTEKSKKMKQKPMNKRAAWKWAVDRGAVASRWTWLHAQVSELDYRVRQQNDIYRQLRLTKDPVILAEPVVRRTPTSSSSAEANKNSLSATGPQGSGYRLQGNGYVVVCGASSSATESTTQSTSGENTVPDDDSTCTAVRTRPMRAFRKRKLIRPTTSTIANRKNLKLSTLRCSCQFPDTTCILCLGRYNRVQTLDPDAMSEEERVALLDSSFHPVLSFQEDKPLALFFGKQLRCDDWMKVVQKPKTSGVKKKGALKSGSKDPAHKHSRKLKKNATATLTAKLRKKLKGQKRNSRGRSLSSMRSSKRDHANERLHKKRAAKRMAMAMKKRRARSLSFSSGGSSKPGSPTPSVGQGENSSGSSQNYQTYQSDHSRRSSLLQDFMRRRRGENAFDINNIVIPYSMAAATRVERLQYKEILTPKWRMVDEVALSGQLKNNGLVQCVAQRDAAEEQEESDKEDTSEEALIRRHDRCEHEEKKRFMSYVHPSWAGSRRTRAGLRSDSRADSSGANTPDHMSPHQLDQESPLTTPPSTPAPATPSLIQEEFLGGSKIGTGGGGGTSGGGGLIHSRRRTTSLSRGVVKDRDRERHQRERQLSEDARTSTPDIEVVPVQPWEARKFPLTDEDFEAMQNASTAASLEAEERDAAERARSSSEDAAGQMPGEALTLISALDPDLDDSESRSAAGDDDPRDPEWTAPLISPCPATPRHLHHEGTCE